MKAIVQALVLMFCLPGIANGAGLRLLKDTPLSELNDADLASWARFVQGSLDELEDGQSALWRAEHIAIRGIVMPKFTYDYGDMTCRRVGMGLKGGRYKSSGYNLEFCRVDGTWKGASTPATLLKDSDWNRLRRELLQALDRSAYGEPVSWFEPSTRNAGVIVVLGGDAEGRPDCRNVAVSVIASNGSIADGNYTFCRDASRSWTLGIAEP